MLDTVLWLVIGLGIGWNFPQPFWARAVQARLKTWLSRK